MTNFEAITDLSLATIHGGVNRDAQTDVNGAIVGGGRIERTPQVDSNGAIVGGGRITPVLRYQQSDTNGAIVGGNRIR